jgi:hypothetical protein
MNASPKLDWVLIYDEGRRLTSADCEVTDIPTEYRYGAQVILQPDPETGHEALRGSYFIYRADKKQWFETDDIIGLVDHFTHFAPHILAVVHGRRIPHEDFREILRRCRDEKGLPRRSALPANQKGVGSL